MRSCEARVAGWQGEGVGCAAGSEIGEDADDLVVGVSFTHDDCGTVGVDWICFVGNIAAVFVDRLVSYLVQFGDPGVQSRRGGVS